MLKTITKRDGSSEPFDPNKLNRWGEWAAKTLGKYVDWPSLVLSTVSVLGETCTSADLQNQLIKTCLDNNSWSNNRMAGRLYASQTHKDLYNNNIPTIKQVHEKLIADNLMVPMGYSDEEYASVEKMIDHRLDFKASYYELQHIRKKYAIINEKTGQEYESQQFVFMRMAMALAETSKPDEKMIDIQKWYNYLSAKYINSPTPNYVNLGTRLKGFASCNVYTTKDTAKSLAVGDHIAYMMTCMSAGIGSFIQTRSLGDPVRGGRITHQGKLPYLRALDSAVHANLQAGRGGACTTHYVCYDPEADVIARLKNPMSPEDQKIRGLDYSFMSNKFFARKVAKSEPIFTFNCFSAPDLWEAMFDGDPAKFERLYAKYEADPLFDKHYVDARELLLIPLNEANETGRAYLFFTDEANRHTPFKNTVYQGNLCAEIMLATKGYDSMHQLYSTEDTSRVEVQLQSPDSERPIVVDYVGNELLKLQNGKSEYVYNFKRGDILEDGTMVESATRFDPPEIGLCSIAGVNIDKVPDADYEDVMYYALKMIDRCIHMNEYVLPHLQTTALARLSAGVGIVGLAHHMAKKHLSYSTQAGKDEINRVGERHMYYAIRASLRLGKELGNAPWMYKTKWVDGWLPIDTYARNLDKISNIPFQFDWEALRAEVVANKGIRNTVLVAHMPSESSSIASGTTNGVYPIRKLALLKGDMRKVTYWAAPEGEKLADWYELAWDIPTFDLIEDYGLIQKWTDQGLSADVYKTSLGAERISSTEMIDQYLKYISVGLKSRYYTVAKTTEGGELMSKMGDEVVVKFNPEPEMQGCDSGACSL